MYIRKLKNLGYTQLEYLESSGTQYIDTGIQCKNSVDVEAKFCFTGAIKNNDMLIAGRNNNVTGGRFLIASLYDKPVTKNRVVYGETVYTYNAQLNSIHTVVKKGSTIYVDDNQVGTGSSVVETNMVNLYLFAGAGYETPTEWAGIGRIYYCKIYDNNTLVRDFIPVKRDSDGTLGMVDIVNGVFYTNVGTGTFTAGPNYQVPVIAILPKEYQQVEYLESTGTQYIDTGLKGNGTTKVDIIYQYHQLGSSTGGTGRIFGSRSSTTSNNISIGSSVGSLVQSNNLYYFGYGTYIQNTTKSIDTNIHNFYYDNTAFKIDGTTYLTTATTTFTTPTNLKMFGFDDNGVIGYGIGRCYSCKIYDNNTLVRNFIPVIRKSDNVAGMYDLVTKTFLTNSGTGDFKTGDIVETVKKRLVYQKVTNVPTGYKQVEYIESNKTPYIDTGIVMKATHKIECKFQALATTTGTTRNYIFSADTTARSVQFSYSTSTFFGVAGKYQQNGSLVMDTNTHLAEVYDNKVFLDGVSQTLDQGTGSGAYASTLTVHLIGQNTTTGHTSTSISNRIYYYKVWNSGVLILDLVPCIDPNGVVGMYDTVNGVFYDNDGTGVFTAGPILREFPLSFTKAYEPLEYIESSGTQYIDTGYKPNNNTSVEFDYQYVVKGSIGTARWSGSPQYDTFGFGYSSNNTYYAPFYFGRYSNSCYVLIPVSDVSLYDKHHFKSNKNVLTIDNTHTYTVTNSTFQSTQNLYLFVSNNNGVVESSNGAGRMYYYKIYDNDTLVRDYIPAKRLSDNVLGMYDLCDGVFLTNQGSGTFTAGNPLEYNRYVLKLFLPRMPKEKTLPKDYTRVEYLQSTGTQYIDTGLIGGSDSKVEVKAFSTNTSLNYALIGARDSGGYSNSFTVWQTANNKIRFDYSADVSETKTTIVWDTTTSHILTKDAEKNYVDGVSVANNSEKTFNCNYSFYLFGVNSGGSFGTNTAFTGNVYYCKIWDNNILVRDFIPVIKKSTGEAIMYDLVTGKEYSNKGNGNFVAGPIIEEVEYINNGTDGYIITDIYPTGNDKAYFKASATTLSSSGNLPMFGNYHNTATTADFVVYLGKQGGYFYYWQNGTQRNFTTSSVANKVFEMSADYKNGVFSLTIDGNTETQTQTPNTFTCANKLPIGARYTTSYGGIQQYNIYGYKHWRNDVLIADLVPVKLTQGTTVEYAMLDKVSGTIYRNKGTGSFTGGEVVIKKNPIRQIIMV